MMTSETDQIASERWDAVCARDARADGTFVFAVRTTGVFCRPNCAARRPLRANVEFFAEPQAARAAGYRPCKRCRPEDGSERAMLAQMIGRACRAIDDAEIEPTLSELAASVGLSAFHFQRTFKRIVGVSPHDYAGAKRAERLSRTLPDHARVADAVYAAGFGSSSAAYSQAAATLGMSPSAFRDGGRGERIRFAARQTAIGWIAVAVTKRGVAAIELGDDRAVVCAGVTARFPTADLAEDETELGPALAAILEYLARPQSGLDLPLDVQGTAFRRRVWRALTQIAPGRTATYAEIAAAIGEPRAVRAVAAACAANPAALAIPCHRVVPKRGDSGGYRWGAARKRALLDAESA